VNTPPSKRRTRQRAAVEDLLAGIDDFRTAQQIHALLQRTGAKVGLTEAGQVDVLLGDDGEARYRACSSGHHHHLVCRQCGRTVEVTASPVERWARQTANRHGFTEVSHTVEIIGLCDTCS
jgi:Fur family ferric uptake transcriptional regulator